MIKKVLVVEDDFDTLQPLAELLRLKGYAVTTASDAERALQKARSERPNLIITDIVLPGKSGLHFITSIRSDQHMAATPIVVISGCGPMILVEAESAGANFCLEKPIVIEQFWNAIDQVFSGLREIESGRQDSPPDARRPIVNEIDNLVQELRTCASKQERDDVLGRLKQEILKSHASRTNNV